LAVRTLTLTLSHNRAGEGQKGRPISRNILPAMMLWPLYSVLSAVAFLPAPNKTGKERQDAGEWPEFDKYFVRARAALPKMIYSLTF
jgi:hypothetical protein